jgi:hypothetical protein
MLATLSHIECLVRALIILACFSLAACATHYDLPLVTAPEPAKAIEGAKKAAAEEKLVGSLEISAVREAYPLGHSDLTSCA